jgi:hypothetical protein
MPKICASACSHVWLAKRRIRADDKADLQLDIELAAGALNGTIAVGHLDLAVGPPDLRFADDH